MSRRNSVLLLTLTFLVLKISPVNAADYHHIHLTAPDAQLAANWYIEHMGCKDFGRVGACEVGDVQILFFERSPAGGSVGSAVDHIGFSFKDLEKKLAQWRNDGVTIVEDMREVAGLFKFAFVQDPWGTKIEVVEDHEDLGFHHIHLRSSNPEETLSWYKDIFAGEFDHMKDRIPGVRFGRVWLLVSTHPEGALEPTQGRSIDHLGWGVSDLDKAAIVMKEKGVEFQMDPRPYTNPLGQDMKISFVGGPDGVRIEVVQPDA